MPNHVTYEVHQFLSPNDNKLHGCKQKWYAEYPQLLGEDSVCLPLRLMQLLDEETELHSKKYFHNNLLGVKRSDLDRMLKE